MTFGAPFKQYLGINKHHVLFFLNISEQPYIYHYPFFDQICIHLFIYFYGAHISHPITVLFDYGKSIKNTNMIILTFAEIALQV